MSCAFLRLFVGQIPDCVLQRELLSAHRPDLRQDTNFEAAHGEEQLWVVLRVYTNESVFPLDSRERPGQTLLDIPKDSAAQIDIVLDESHPAIPRPAPLVIVSDDIVVGGIRIGR